MNKYLSRSWFFLCSAIIILSLTSCTGVSKLDKVYATSFFNEAVLELPVSGNANLGAYSFNGGMFFLCRKNFSEILNSINDLSERNNITVEKYSYLYPSGEQVLIRIFNDNGTTDDYCIRYYPRLEEKNNRYWYHYSGMKAYINYAGDEPVTLLLPYHLITDARFYYDTAAMLNAGAEYAVGAPFDDGYDYALDFWLNEFYDFYYNSGWYEVEKLEDTLIIRKDGEAFVFRFVTHIDQVYFSVESNYSLNNY